MKILVLADNFLPEIAATSFRTHEHARVWIEMGHEVTVVTCAPNWPRGKVFDGYRNQLFQEEYIDGIRVIRVWSYIAANKGFFKRTLDYVSYLVSVVAQCWRFPKFDVVLATSPQFFTAVAGWLISLLCRRPWLFELRDLWPESIRAVGASQSRLLDLLESLEMFLYRQANRIVAVTNAFRENLISRGIDGDKIDVVTNGVDVDRFARQSEGFHARKKLGVGPEKFLVGYIGTTGMAHGLETLLQAAQLCQDQPDIQFLIIGDGAEREELEALAERENIDNLMFVKRVPHDEMPDYLAAIDLPIIHLRPDPVFRTVIPSKLFEFMAAGLPVLHAVEGESARIVEEARCGACIPSGDSTAMAAAVKSLRADPDLLRQMGARGRETAIARFDRRLKAQHALRSIEVVVPPQSSPIQPAPVQPEPVPLRNAA